MTYQNERAPAAVNGRGARNGGERFHVQNASAEPLLQRVEGVQRSGNGWRARCPACGGTSRKLAIAESEGRVLLHCFCCGDAAAILAAVGLTWADLQPPRHLPESPEERRRARRAIREAGWASALAVLSIEATVVRIAAAQVARWQPLSEDDDRRVALAVERIDRAAAVMVEANSWRPAA
ncbi:hypothetical protein J2X06_001584 [Lysobacter niastensis]|uniref:DNA primase n=1 Tax=Lysobacter niastensis TaxID=380629 RepID=A0ABU1WAL8_9GAMM|nr:hypothetical protein [Lysobacter niastensis]MDR7134400.1 hypothetical protein [Lysobacter niastensis]